MTVDIDSNLELLLAFSDGAGTSVTDSSGYGRNAALVNGPTWTAGKIGPYSAALDGVDDYIDLTNNAALSPPAITYAGWFYFSAFSNAYTALISRDDPTYAAQLMINASGKLVIYVVTPGGLSWYDGNGAHTLVINTWYHLAFTYDSVAGLVGYVNAASDNVSAPVGPIPTISAITTVGKDAVYAGRLMTGRVDEVRIYSRALAALDVAALVAYTGESYWNLRSILF